MTKKPNDSDFDRSIENIRRKKQAELDAEARAAQKHREDAEAKKLHEAQLRQAYEDRQAEYAPFIEPILDRFGRQVWGTKKERVLMLFTSETKLYRVSLNTPLSEAYKDVDNKWEYVIGVHWIVRQHHNSNGVFVGIEVDQAPFGSPTGFLIVGTLTPHSYRQSVYHSNGLPAGNYWTSPIFYCCAPRYRIQANPDALKRALVKIYQVMMTDPAKYSIALK